MPMQPLSEHFKLDQTRFKDRFKYKFQHLVFDLTHTKTLRGQDFIDPSFEVEVEIADMNHLTENMKDFGIFNKLIRRYLQNLAALTKIIENIKVDLVNHAIQTMPP